MNQMLILRIPFGKRKGMLFSEIPTDYLQWLLTADLDEDMDYTVKIYLELKSEKVFSLAILLGHSSGFGKRMDTIEIAGF